MKSSKEYLDYLWKQYLSKQATASELEQLFNIINDTKNEEQVVDSLQSELQSHSFEDQLIQDQKNIILEAILKKTQPVPLTDVKPGVPLVHRLTNWPKTWFKYAAVLILIIGSISYFLFQNDDNQNPISETKENNLNREEIKPGGSRATLTLADGSIIILDSVSNGTLAREGNSEIIQIDAGKLVYNNLKNGGSALNTVYNIITTPRGGQYQLILADGSKVWLNAASSLRFPTAFVGKERRVELAGEGYFEIAHNKEQSFHVKVNEMEVQVLGTHFNVKAYEDEHEIKTSVLEGKVEVRKGQHAVTLNPGQQSQLKSSGNTFKKISNVNLEDVVAWKNGAFQFSSADIQTILRQAARWYDVSIVYEGQINETFSGGMRRSENISQLLKILESTGKVDFNINGKQIIVKPKKD